MKTLILIILITLSFVCVGQNNLQILSTNKFDKSFAEADSVFKMSGYIWTNKDIDKFSIVGITDSMKNTPQGKAWIKKYGNKYITESQLKNKTFSNIGRVADFGNYISAGGYNGYTGSTYTFKKAEYIIMLDQIKVTDTIWIQSGKKKIGVPSWKFLALLGYADGAEKLCPVCGKDFLWNTSSLRNKNGYIWKQYNCEHCDYHEVHCYTKSEN